MSGATPLPPSIAGGEVMLLNNNKDIGWSVVNLRGRRGK